MKKHIFVRQHLIFFALIHHCFPTEPNFSHGKTQHFHGKTQHFVPFTSAWSQLHAQGRLWSVGHCGRLPLGGGGPREGGGDVARQIIGWMRLDPWLTHGPHDDHDGFSAWNPWNPEVWSWNIWNMIFYICVFSLIVWRKLVVSTWCLMRVDRSCVGWILFFVRSCAIFWVTGEARRSLKIFFVTGWWFGNVWNNLLYRDLIWVNGTYRSIFPDWKCLEHGWMLDYDFPIILGME